MIPLISDVLRDALVEQISQELYNSHFYLRLAVFLENKGMPNHGKLYRSAYQEERGHAIHIVNLLSDMNIIFDFPYIDGCAHPFESFLDVAEAGYEREDETTKSLIAIKNLAIEEDNGIVEESIRKLISDQQKEMVEASEILDKARVIGSDWKSAVLLDASFEMED